MSVTFHDLGPAWVKAADAAEVVVTVQAQSEKGMQYIFDAGGLPDPLAEGLVCLPWDVVTRALGPGHIYLKEVRVPNDNRSPGRAAVLR